jgi:hypothetical protein
MHRYRVHVVPGTGGYAPLLTVLVKAASAVEAIQAARALYARDTVVSAESVDGLHGAVVATAAAVPSTRRVCNPLSADRLYFPSYIEGGIVL